MRLTRSLWVMWAAVAALSARGQGSNAPVRELSLSQCIELAVRNNRQLQIERINPQIRRATLDGSYGIYDPMLAFDVNRRYEVSTPSSFNASTGLPYAGNTSESVTFSPGMSAYLPSGGTFTGSSSLWQSSSDRFDDTKKILAHSQQWQSVFNMELKQPLLKNFWIDSRRMSIQVNRRDLKISELTFSGLVMDIVTKVNNSYYDVVYSLDYLKVQESTLASKQRFFEETRRKAEVGTQAELDVKLAEADVARVQAGLVSARNAVVLSENTLKQLLGDSIAREHGVGIRPTDPLVVVPFTPNIQESWQRGVTNRPDLVKLKYDLEKSDIQLKYSYNQLYPQLDLTASYGRNGVGSDWWPATSMLGPTDPDAPKDFIGGTLRIPLTRRAERNDYRAKRFAKAQAILTLKQKEESVVKEIDDAVQNVKSSLEKVYATRVATQYAQAALEAEVKRLAAGKSTAYFVLSLQTSLAVAQADEISAKTEYIKNQALLWQSEASTLERKNIVVEIR